MATFIGTTASGSIGPSVVSPMVSVSPGGSRPSASADFISAGGGEDYIEGGGGDDIIYGGTGYDTICGGDQADDLKGGAGADRLDGGTDDDFVFGDEASYSGSSAAIDVSLATGLGFGGDAQGDILTEIEDLVGTAFGDFLIGDAERNYILGDSGNDTISGLGGDDHLPGADGADVLDGGVGDDVLYGGADTDVLRGGRGADELWGAYFYETDVNDDTASYTESASGVSVDLASGLGRYGSVEGDRLEQIENLEGSALADTLTGDATANRLMGFGGNDTFRGGPGADTLDGGAGGDQALYDDSAAGVGVDLQLGIGWGGTAAGDRLSLVENLGGSSLGDALYGDALANELLGRDGADALNGHDGDDHLSGGEGLDTLRGGAANDTLDGGAGVDRFELKPGGGSDLVVRFEDGVDLLYFPGFGRAFDSAAELLPCATVVDGITRISVPDPWATGQTAVTLARFDFANLDAADFVFA